MSILSRHDTIVAPATPKGESAIALIRASGPLCKKWIEEAIRVKKIESRKATLGIWYNKEGKKLDEILWVYFPSPHSYTGDDVLEISIHGNPYIIQQLLHDLLQRGGRLAEAGEFTRRAFLNGKMDLSQAEAVADWIHARTESALQAAQAQKGGAISREMATRCEELLQLVAWLEAYIDFPDEDLPDPDYKEPLAQLENLLERIQTLIETEQRGRFLREGIKVVLIGEPNAGKSSLLNALLKKQRALVSTTPGTTRDYITEEWYLADYRIQITDTAGIRSDSEDPLEKLGMEASLEQLKEADLILLVVDGSEPPSAEWNRLMESLRDHEVLLLLNKKDLTQASEWQKVTSLPSPALPLSALEKESISELESAILEWIEEKLPAPLPEQILLNTRHVEALQTARQKLLEAKSTLISAAQLEFVVADLREAMRSFEQIVGRIDNERMLDKLFAHFCIGK